MESLEGLQAMGDSMREEVNSSRPMACLLKWLQLQAWVIQGRKMAIYANAYLCKWLLCARRAQGEKSYGGEDIRMSSIASESCGHELDSYASSNVGYDYDSDEGYEGEGMTHGDDGKHHYAYSDSEYDGVHGSYDGTYDHNQGESDPYYSGGNYEASDSHGSYEDDEGVEEFDDESYGEDESYEKSHATHHGHGGDFGYIPSSHLCYESIDGDLHEMGSGDEREPYGYVLCGEYTREDSEFEHEPCEEFYDVGGRREVLRGEESRGGARPQVRSDSLHSKWE
ncbi:uncharacterized protein LOC132601590 [Lycium barbarum]|uniref:uncharacterized protein LOC132601590 n=1 Tax=Lycium barbarum TaxID=112863 RepID=UPI00293E7ADB|nr:uncharacterized protein LOC132601590 [Lycium barbarum]